MILLRQKYWKNSAFLMLSRVVAKVGTISFMVVAARTLGTTSFGAYSAIIAWTTLVGLVSDFGLIIPTIRSLSSTDYDENDILSSAFSTRVVWGGISILIFFVLSLYLNFSLEISMLLALSSVLETFSTAFIRTFESKLEIAIITAYIVIERVSFCFFGIGALLVFGSLQSVAVASIISFSLMVFLSYSLFKNKFRTINLQFTFYGFLQQCRLGLPFFVSAVFGVLYYKTDTILLALFRTNDEVGVYNAAMRIIDAQIFIPSVLMTSLFPTLSKLFQEKNPHFSKMIFRAGIAFFAIGISISLFLFYFSPTIIHILYSTGYEHSLIVLRILLISQVFYFLHFLFAHGLIAMNKEKYFTIATVVSAVMNIVSNVIFIPVYGYEGAAWVRVFTDILLCLLICGFYYYHLKYKLNLIYTTKNL